MILKNKDDHRFVISCVHELFQTHMYVRLLHNGRLGDEFKLMLTDDLGLATIFDTKNGRTFNKAVKYINSRINECVIKWQWIFINEFQEEYGDNDISIRNSYYALCFTHKTKRQLYFNHDGTHFWASPYTRQTTLYRSMPTVNDRLCRVRGRMRHKGIDEETIATLRYVKVKISTWSDSGRR